MVVMTLHDLVFTFLETARFPEQKARIRIFNINYILNLGIWLHA